MIPEAADIISDARNCELWFYAVMGFAAGWLAFFAFSAWAAASARAAAKRRCFLPDRVLDENRRRDKLRKPDKCSVRFP